MKRAAQPSVSDAAMRVGDALRRHGIVAVLTGGACASLHSRGAYASMDIDFVLTPGVRQADLDLALASVGYARRGDRYLRAGSPFWIEFPRGPLAIGADFRLTPVTLRRRHARTLALSPTDSCRDRLAAFFHWKDRQALNAAVEIALTNRLGYATIRRWSAGEDSVPAYEEFLSTLRRARAQRRG